ncbi:MULTISPECIES: hypothetical protein [unclassified Endozoicomonas]|uniref:hypothetical protein n=1 Tax=unclassified Endozoicomonas TaxID=2644528 RepID=UPI003BB64AE0
MPDAYIYDGGRRPFGRDGGALSSIRPDDLLGDIIRTLIQRNAFDLNQYEDVIAGGTQRVPRLAGVKNALNLMTSGQPLEKLAGTRQLNIQYE